MKLRRTIIVICLAFIVGPLTSADPSTEITDRFESRVEMWINGELSAEALLEELDALGTLVVPLSRDWERTYWEARIARFRGEILFQTGRRDESLAALEESVTKSEQSIAVRETGDAWRVMAEASSLSMAQRGFAYIVLNSAKPRNQAERALELDPTNARAAVVVALSLCNTPRIVGGDFKAGVSMLEEILARDDPGRVDRYRALIGLANVLLNDGQEQRALELCRQAQQLFPGSPEAAELCERASS
jgi:tetratricopeptide (TPR) repeat protein